MNQRQLPDEDAKSLVFDDTNLFETTKFSGYDRLETGDARQRRRAVHVPGQYRRLRPLAGRPELSISRATTSTPTRAVDPDSTPDDPLALYSPRSGLETDRSDYVLGVYLAPVDFFRILIAEPLRRGEPRSRARGRDRPSCFYGPLLLQSVYAFAAADPLLGTTEDQQDVTGTMGLKLTDRWSLTASMRYDIDDAFRLADSIGLQYLDECFMLSVTYGETFIEDPEQDIDPDQVVMVRFELKNLGSMNYKTNVTDYVNADVPLTTP